MIRNAVFIFFVSDLATAISSCTS